jgi:hypothetical protein
MSKLVLFHTSSFSLYVHHQIHRRYSGETTALYPKLYFNIS